MKLENRFTVPVPRDEAWKVLLDVERITPCLPGAKLLSHDGDNFTGQVKVKLGPINLTYSGKASFVDLDEAGGVVVIDAQGKETRGTGTAKAKITCRLIDQGASTDIEVDTDLAITGKPAQFGRGVLADVSAKLVDQFAACLSEEIQEGTPTGAGGTADASGTADSGTAATAATGVQADSPLPVGPPATSGIDMAIEEDLSLGGDSTVASSAPAAATPAAAAAPAATAAAAPAAAPAPAAASTTPRAPRQEAEAIDLLGTAGLPVAKRLAPALAVLAVLALIVRALRR
jgi:carbon monoxide dehydrogenase subunit G